MMVSRRLIKGAAALICAAALLSSDVMCLAADPETIAREAAFTALERLGFSIREPIYFSTMAKLDVADESLLDNACIIGHSHAVGMQMSLDVSTDYIAEVGMIASGMLTHPDFSLPDGSTGTLRQGLSTKSYERIYILLGSNDILGGRAHLPTFKREMQTLLETIESLQPEAKLCLLSIAPLGESFMEYCSYHYGVTAEVMDAYNYAIRTLAVENDMEYLDITSPLCDAEGYLDAAYDRGDGLHFNKEGNEMILECILTHREDEA